MARRPQGEQAAPEAAERRLRILVVGSIGLDAELCLSWTDPAPNAADFDVAVVIPPTVEILRTVGWDSFSEYRERFRQLLESHGELFVLSGPREDWHEEGKSVVYGSRDTYEWCPVRVSVRPERGTVIADIAPEFAWYFERMERYDVVMSHPRGEDDARSVGQHTYQVFYEIEALARNRAKEALGTRVRYQLHELVTDVWPPTRLNPNPSLISGWSYFIGLAPPWTAERAAETLLTERFDRSGSSAVPAWVGTDFLPPTPEHDARIAAIDGEIAKLREELTATEKRRADERSIVGLLYESGARLENLVADALDELGAALGAAVADEEYTALDDGALAAVEVKGNSKSASQDDYRALADYLSRHDLTENYVGSRGILVVNAWRQLPLDQRREWFPDNVQRAARAAGRISLIRTVDLYRAVLAHRAGDSARAREFMRRIFSESGEVAFDGGS